MLTYNTRLKPLILPEYGRNIQSMVDHCLTIEDREQRTACAHTIFAAMKRLFPAKCSDPEALRAMWDHIAVMSDFKLDIDWPYEVIDVSRLDTRPEQVQYTDSEVKYRHYGRQLPRMVQYAADMPEGDERDTLVMQLANQMKKVLLAITPEGVDDVVVFNDIARMSHGAIRLNPETCRLRVFEEAPKPTTKKRRKK